MRAIVSIIAGIIIVGLFGSPRSGWFAPLWGGSLGYLLFAVCRLSTRLDDMQRELERLRPERSQRVAGDRAATPEPATATPPHINDEIIDLVEPAEEPWVLPVEEPRSQADAPPSCTTVRPVLHIPSSQRPAAGAPSIDWPERIGSGENLLVKLGVVILFFGVAFLVKYAAQHGLFPLELRLTGAALGGSVLLAVGWRLREKRPVYAQVIQGGGIGILYLTTFAAMRLYHLIPTMGGFGFLVMVCALAGILAILQDAPPLAVLGSAGGFLAPELAAIGAGSQSCFSPIIRY